MIISTFLVLSTLIHAAPIPKIEREGTILLVDTSPQPAEMFLMKPSGKIIKRFELNGIDGIIYSVRLNHSATKAIVLRYQGARATTIGGDRTWPHTSIYLVDLEKTDAPAKLIIKDLASMYYVAWLPNDQGIIFSDLDEKEANATKAGELFPYRSWMYHFENGKKEQLKLPKGHVVVDLSPDGKTLLTRTDYNLDFIEKFKKSRSYLTSLDTMQPKMISDSSFYGLRFSPDGKWITVSQWTKLKNPSQYDITHHMLNLNTKDIHPIRIPEQAESSVDLPSWTDKGTNVAFIWREQIPNPKKDDQKLFRYSLSLSSISGDAQKLIYQSKPGEEIIKIDWR